jgi:hypothetical protein
MTTYSDTRFGLVHAPKFVAWKRGQACGSDDNRDALARKHPGATILPMGDRPPDVVLQIKYPSEVSH